jgi:hypothetical protein
MSSIRWAGNSGPDGHVTNLHTVEALYDILSQRLDPIRMDENFVRDWRCDTARLRKKSNLPSTDIEPLRPSSALRFFPDRPIDEGRANGGRLYWFYSGFGSLALSLAVVARDRGRYKMD